LYANSIEDHLDELAHHYSRSGNVPKALEYQERAGRRALQRSAYADAMRALTAAIELLMRLPESTERDQRELGLQTTLGPVLMITKGWAAPETERVSLRVQELVETGGTAAQRFSLLTGLFGTAYVGADSLRREIGWSKLGALPASSRSRSSSSSSTITTGRLRYRPGNWRQRNVTSKMA